jgi:hypothetical protein
VLGEVTDVRLGLRNGVPCVLAIVMGSCGVDEPLGELQSGLDSQLTRLRAHDDATNNYYAMTFSGTFAYHRLYLDTDEATTGFATCGLGAEYLIENTHLYQYAGTGTNWSWTDLGTVTNTISTAGAAWTVARSAVGEAAFPNRARMCFETKDAAGVKDTSAIYTHVYSDESEPVHAFVAYNDAATIYYQATFDASVAYKHVFIDTDESVATGYANAGIGANFMIENGTLYQYTGSGSTWSWSSVGSANMSPSTAGAVGVTTWSIARSAVGETAASERADLVFHGSPTYTAIYDHVYSGGTSTPPPGTIEDTSYGTDPNDELRNPERGFFHNVVPDGNDYHTLMPAYLYLDQVCDDTLVWDGYTAGTTSPVLKTFVQTKLIPARNAGAKVIFRPRYDTQSGHGPSPCTIGGVNVFHADAASGADPLAIQKNHIEAVARMIADNKDVIAFIQAGYLGRWGEWNTNDHADETAPWLYDDTQRAAVIDYVRARYEHYGIEQDVELRRPVFAKEIVERDADANIGLHSDCYMSNDSDGGTYSDFEDIPQNFGDEDLAREWAEDFTTNASFGGETCNAGGSERWRSCADVLDEMPDIHVGYLNGDYSEFLLDALDDDECLDDVLRNLGYRFKVTRVVYTPSTTAGGSFTVNVDVINTGWARLQKPRDAAIVLRGPTTHTYLPSNRDTELWAPGETRTLAFTGTAPAAGTYTVRLAIPDPDAPTDIDYAIKLATTRNGTSVFDPATGDNNLGVTITVQ